MRIRSCIAYLSILLTLCVVFTPVQAQPNQIAVLRVLSQTVTIDGIVAVDGQSLSQGSKVETNASGKAIIYCRTSYNNLALPPNTFAYVSRVCS
jgi:hypothetical protein